MRYTEEQIDRIAMLLQQVLNKTSLMQMSGENLLIGSDRKYVSIAQNGSMLDSSGYFFTHQWEKDIVI